MQGPFKTGRLPAVRPAALKDLSAYAVGPLPTPPVTVEVPGQKYISSFYPIDGNDRYGDCTIAGVAHLIEAWNMLAGGKYALPIPDEADIIAAWRQLNGGTEEGLVEAEVLKAWSSPGLFGEQIAGYAPCSTTSLLEWHQAIAFYGALYLGINVGQPQQEQFRRGEEWTWQDGQEEDGHCVVAIGYGPHGGLHCATWGGIAVLSPGFLAHGLEEAWVILPEQMVQAKGDSLGLDLAALQADLARL